MLNSIKRAAQLASMAVLLMTCASAVANAQTNTGGTVAIGGTVSKFVELNSGGSVTLTGKSGGGLNTDGTVDQLLAVNVALGELGPSNASSFVKASVPLKLRSNTNYVLSMSATVNTTGTSLSRILASDIGFGMGTVVRSGTGVASGSDTDNTAGDPTVAANGAINGTSGKFEFTAARSNLGAFSSSTTVLSGPRILNAVPRTNLNGLVVPAIFAVKPQFYEDGATTALATFTIAAP
jgi:hypothetical protein